MNVQPIDYLRDKLGAIDKELMALRDEFGFLGGEAVANLMLAHRHIEDARMRLGKVIQSVEGGVSILDHPRVKALIAEIRAQ